jgi:anti-sigma regulatory factor (Ser/Thr protein kinase)
MSRISLGSPTYFWRGPSDCSLAAALAESEKECVESGTGSADAFFGTDACSAFKANTLCVSLTAVTAYRQPTARLFTAELVRRAGLDADLRTRVETALHEAVVNGVVHGDLEIASDLRDRLEDLEALGSLVESRLGDPAYGGRRLSIHAWWTPVSLDMTVFDDGKSEIAIPSLDDQADQSRKSGRGLLILQRLADSVVLGRPPGCVHLRFRRG